MGDDSAWPLLEVIGGQPVVVWADEALKIEPGPASQLAQLAALIVRKRMLLALDGSADPEREQRGYRPRQQQQCGDGQRLWVEQPHQRRQPQREQRDTAHLRPECPYSRFPAEQADGVRRGGPLQEPLTANGEAHQCASDGIHHQQGLVGEESQIQQPAWRLDLCRRRGGVEGCIFQASGQLGRGAGEEGHGGREQRRQRPYPRGAGQP